MISIFTKAKAYYAHTQAKADALYAEADTTGSYNTFLMAESVQEEILEGISDYMERYRRTGC